MRTRLIFFNPFYRAILVSLIPFLLVFLGINLGVNDYEIISNLLFPCGFIILGIFVIGKRLNIFFTKNNHYVYTVFQTILNIPYWIYLIISDYKDTFTLLFILFLFNILVDAFYSNARFKFKFNYEQMYENYKQDIVVDPYNLNINGAIGFLLNKKVTYQSIHNKLIKEKYNFHIHNEKLIQKINNYIYLFVSLDILDGFPIITLYGDVEHKIKIKNMKTKQIGENIFDSHILIFSDNENIENHSIVGTSFKDFHIDSEQTFYANYVGIVNFAYVFDKSKFDIENPAKEQIEYKLKKENIIKKLKETYINDKLQHNFRGIVKSYKILINPITKQEIYQIICEVNHENFELIGSPLSILNKPKIGDILEGSIGFYCFLELSSTFKHIAYERTY